MGLKKGTTVLLRVIVILGMCSLLSYFIPKMMEEEIESTYSAPDILLICVDTLRPDHLGLYGYERQTSPRIDEAFGNALVFENAYAPEANTTPSVVSFLTGLAPSKHGVRFLFQKVPHRLPLVTGRLGESGYQTAAVVSNMVLTREATQLDKHFDYFDDYVDEEEPGRPVYERRAGPTTDAVIKWLSAHRDSNRPSFIYVHYMDPHGPYSPPADKPVDFTHTEVVNADMSRIKAYQQKEGVTDGNEYVDLYDEEIAYTDREIGRLLDAAKKVLASENTIVIFTADHGESMMEHEQWFTHGYHVYEEVIRVPLAIRGPGFKNARVKEAVSIQDLAPTILDAAGLPLDSNALKRVLNESPGERDVFSEATLKDVFSDKTPPDEITQRRCLIKGSNKWVVELSKDSYAAAAPVVYDLSVDPDELQPTPTEASDKAYQPLKSRIEKDRFWTRKRAVTGYGHRIKAPKVAPGVDEETLEKLKALGYVE